MCHRDQTWIVESTPSTAASRRRAPLRAPAGFGPTVQTLEAALDAGQLDALLRAPAVARVPMNDISTYEELVSILDILDEAASLEFEPSRGCSAFRFCPLQHRTVRRRMALIVDARWLIAWYLLETRKSGGPWTYQDETWVLGRSPRLRRHLLATPELARLREPFLGMVCAEEGLGSLVATLADVELSRFSSRKSQKKSAR